MNSTELAIIIPAYKATFLEQTLCSIVMQTNHSFHVYVGDDASPDSLEDICRKFTNKITLSYHRFNSNLGSNDLVAHWERCINLSKNEPYIWLFSDDDIMPNDAVAQIENCIKTTGSLFMRLPLCIINENNEICHSNPLFYKSTSNYKELLIDKLGGRTSTAAIEYIFHRSIYKKNEGFVHFPLAWCSDDATWTKFAYLSGKITNIGGSPVKWRNVDGINISNSKNYNQKLEATHLFIIWLQNNFPNLRKDKSFRKALYHYLHTVIKVSLNKEIPIYKLAYLCITYAEIDKIRAIKLWLNYFYRVKWFN